jgi:hypothetical protein
MLIGLCFGYAHAEKYMAKDTRLIPLLYDLAQRQVLTTEGVPSHIANFKPGAQKSDTPIPVGAQTVCYLAALKVGIDALQRKPPGKVRDFMLQEMKKKYWIRFWLYGAFIDVMMPTAGIWFKRGYNNDNVVIQALYVCHKYEGPINRLFYKIGIIWVWSLSWPWLNGFFTGLLDETTGLVPRFYLHKCQRYANSFKNVVNSKKVTKRKTAWSWPVETDSTNVGEFFPDEDQERQKFGRDQYQSTLGQLANMVWTLE